LKYTKKRLELKILSIKYGNSACTKTGTSMKFADLADFTDLKEISKIETRKPTVLTFALIMAFVSIAITIISTSYTAYASISNTQTTVVYATPSNINVSIDGQPAHLQAYNINGYNFFRLRDLAYVLNGTLAQFDVIWNSEANSIALLRNTPYTVVGGEMTNSSTNSRADNRSSTTSATAVIPATPTASFILLDDAQISPRGYLINDNNFFMLRELGEIIFF